MGDFVPPQGWGPDGRRAAVSITFDNLGEAADIEFGQWPQHVPIGDHYSVTQALPVILRHLAALGLPATFYVEGWNATHYPGALAAIRSAGHEIGLHGWRHEIWDKVDGAQRPALLDRCLEDMAAIGIAPRGFRPPGGGATDDLVPLLRERGFAYHSSVGAEVTLERGIVALPFSFTDIDGFQIEPAMQGAAVAGEDPTEAHARLLAHVQDTLDRAAQAGTHRMLIFHPWIIGASPERLALLRDALALVRARSDFWIARADDVARFIATRAPAAQSADAKA